MLAFGSAEASLRLLWRFGLLEILLPIQVQFLFYDFCIYVNTDLVLQFSLSLSLPCPNQLYIVSCRHHILFPKDSGGVMQVQICFWLGLLIVHNYKLQCHVLSIRITRSFPSFRKKLLYRMNLKEPSKGCQLTDKREKIVELYRLSRGVCGTLLFLPQILLILLLYTRKYFKSCL